MSRSATASRGARRPVATPEPDAVRYGPLENWVGFHLRLAQTASFAAFAREVEDVDLSPGRFATLVLIKENPGISQTTLSRANARDKSTLTPVLDDLVRRGLVRRARTEADRRSYALTLTPSGEKMLARLMDCARRHDANLDRIIGAKDRDLFLRVLRRIQAEI
jgi:DNA-binding MarR family transcriptional regulator